MKKDIVSKQLEVYEKQFEEHGDSPDGTYNQNSVIQNLRFERLLKQYDFENNDFSVHDIGCGICDLYQYMKDHKISAKYSGTDIVEGMKTLANKKYPEIEVKVRDILNTEISEKYDIVVLAGTFNIPGEVPREDWKVFVRNMIKKMFEMAEVGITFNFLSTFAEYYHELMHYENPGDLMEFCKEELSRFVIVDHAYPLYEQTITVLKPEYVQKIYHDELLKKYF
ncbi:MAG: class I SAM-dependent methyltransferase [Flavobacteriales bacterium]|jgi:hypothetical protein|nr:class I SAM-dependent methyltransferase [Flavobacteriales bacterium]